MSSQSSVVADRPAYHPTPPQGWMSDPNGPLYWNGAYHVYYQHNPRSTQWGLMHWGHLVSTDLVHWRDRGIALRPSPEGPDSAGAWSGCARIIEGRPTFFYTAASGEGEHHAEVVRTATAVGSLDELVPDAVPIVPSVTPGSGLLQHRDPFVLRSGDQWLMLLATGLEGEEAGAVVSFVSTDLVHWTSRGVAFSLPRALGDIDLGPVWECPLLLRIGDDWVLIISVQLPGPLCPYAVWFVGDFDGTTFTSREHGLVDHGDVYYAPATLEGLPERQLAWGWIQEAPGASQTSHPGIAGAMSLPRELSVVDGRLATRPAVELSSLPVSGVAAIVATRLEPDDVLALGAAGPSFRLRFTVEPGEGLVVARVGTAGDSDVFVGVDHRPGREHLVVAIGDLTGVTPWHEARLRTLAGPTAVEVYVDHSILEVFSGGESITTRIGRLADSAPVVLTAFEAAVASHLTAVALDVVHPVVELPE